VIFRVKITHRIEDVLIECTYKTGACYPRDFIREYEKSLGKGEFQFFSNLPKNLLNVIFLVKIKKKLSYVNGDALYLFSLLKYLK
jgi:hypothetical protein